MDYLIFKERLLEVTTQNQIITLIDSLINESVNRAHRVIILEQSLEDIQSIKKEYLELFNLYKVLCVERSQETIRLKDKIKIVHPELKALSTKEACATYTKEMRNKRDNCSKFIELLSFGQLYIETKIKDNSLSNDNYVDDNYVDENSDIKSNIAKSNKRRITKEKHTNKLFIDYLHHENKEALTQKLHDLLDGRKGKIVAITIKALEQLGFISVDSRSAIYKAMRDEFGEIGSDQSINPIMNNFRQYSLEIEQQMKILKEVK